MRAFIVIAFLPKKKEMPSFRQKWALMVGGVQSRARRRLMINNGNQPTNQPTKQRKCETMNIEEIVTIVMYSTATIGSIAAFFFATQR